jgi:hypothetical protein
LQSRVEVGVREHRRDRKGRSQESVLGGESHPP